MKSSELLLFIKERFVNVYKEHPNTDYLIALKNLADEINDKDFKINFLQGQNNELSAENQFLNDEYQQFIEMLPNDARYLDMPDGGSVHPSEQMRRMIADLNNQNDGLVAQVGRMQTFIRLSATKWMGVPEVEPTFLSLLRVANQQPEDALRDIQAEAARDAYQQAVHDYQLSEMNYENFDVQSRSNQYADSVKAGDV